jgi:hypothetical protein
MSLCHPGREHLKAFVCWSTLGIANQLLSSNVNVLDFCQGLCQKDIEIVTTRLPLLLGANAMPIGGQK